jgi:hypothetical protein
VALRLGEGRRREPAPGGRLGVVAPGPFGRFAQDGERLARRSLAMPGGVEVGIGALGGRGQELLGRDAGDGKLLGRRPGEVGPAHERIEVAVHAEQLERLERQVEQHPVGLDQATHARLATGGQRAHDVDQPGPGRRVEPAHDRHHRVEIERRVLIVAELELEQPHDVLTTGSLRCTSTR